MKIRFPNADVLEAVRERRSTYDPPRRNGISKQATELRDDLFASMSEMIAKAQTENRDLFASEQREYDDAEKILDELGKIAHDSFIDYERQGLGSRSGSEVEYREGVPLARDQSVAGYVLARQLVRDEEDELDLRKYLRGMATGDWQDAEAERRAMAEGTSSAGGYLVPTLLSAQIIDMVRNQTRVMQAGATIVPMENSILNVPKWTGDPTAAWHTENAVISPSDATLGTLQLKAQALASNVEVSWELLEDAPGVETKLREAFAAQFALKLDYAALYGSGTAPEPRGVKNTTGITTASMGANGAAPGSMDVLIDAVGRLADNNETATGIIYAGRTAREFAKLKDSTGQPLRTPEFLANVPRFDTNQVPINLTQGSSSAASDIFTADWRQLLIGVRTQLMIKVLTERYSDNGQTGFVAWWRGDIAVARPKAFDATTGVI